MSKLAIYPYNSDADVIIKNRLDIINDYEVAAIIQYDSKKNGIIPNNIINIHDINSNCNSFDTILLSENVACKSLNMYKKVIMDAEQYDKSIILSHLLYTQLNNSSIYVKDCNIIKNNVPFEKSTLPYTVKQIDIPTISVIGLGENTGKFKVQKQLHSYFISKGYNVLSLCSNPLGFLFGMLPLPMFLYENTLTFYDKILLFNQYVFELCKEKKTDLIICGSPSGILPLNDAYHNYFGEIPLILSSALESDISIFTTYLWPTITEDFFDEISKLCLKKYNANIFAFCISSQDCHYDEDLRMVEYYFYDETFISKNYPNITDSKYSILNLNNNFETEALFDEIFNSLASNLPLV